MCVCVCVCAFSISPQILPFTSSKVLFFCKFPAKFFVLIIYKLIQLVIQFVISMFVPLKTAQAGAKNT